MTLDQLIRASALVEHSVSFDKFGNEFCAWLNKSSNGKDYMATPTILVGAPSCEEAMQELARRLSTFLQEGVPHPGAEQALKILDLQPRGLSVWQHIRAMAPAR